MTIYKIRSGERFSMDDGTQLFGGNIVDLPDDVAAMHAHRLETVQVTDPPSVVESAESPK